MSNVVDLIKVPEIPCAECGDVNRIGKTMPIYHHQNPNFLNYNIMYCSDCLLSALREMFCAASSVISDLQEGKTE